MVVGQFGAYINEMMEDWDRGVYPGDVILTSDPFKCSASISHTNDWLVLVPIFYEDELVGWSSQFGHQMDAGGPLPARCPTGAKTIFEEGIIIPPIKIIERGEPQEDVLRLIFNNVRLPEMNRADLFAIVAGCRAGEKRVIELCERFGKETYLAGPAGAARPYLRGDAHADPAGDPRRAAVVRGLDRRRRARQRALQDEADDLARGRPRLLRLVGHRPAGARADQLLPLRGHVQDVHRDLPDHGQRSTDPLQRRLLSTAARRHARRIAAPPQVPGRARLSYARAGPAVRRARRRAGQAGAGAEHGRRLRDEPVHALFGWDSKGEFYYSMEILYGGIPGRPIGDGMDGHSWWPLFENIPTEYLEAYYPLRIDGYTTVTDSGGAGFHRGGNAVEKRYVYLEPARSRSTTTAG
jgi:N-methylhydantoinase B